MRAEESAAGWDWSGQTDEELAGSTLFARYRLRYATEELGQVLRRELRLDWLADRLAGFVQRLTRN